MTEPAFLDTLRLDKWLWAARFFKTRPLAAVAINGGKIHLNGQRCKPSKMIVPGDQLCIRKGVYSWDVEVNQLPKQRRPARDVYLYYTETPESVAQREAIEAQLKAEQAANPYAPTSRPSKKDRRQIHSFKQAADHA